MVYNILQFKILGSKSCSDGIMSFTSDGKFVYVHNLMNPRPIVLDAGILGQVICV